MTKPVCDFDLQWATTPFEQRPLAYRVTLPDDHWEGIVCGVQVDGPGYCSTTGKFGSPRTAQARGRAMGLPGRRR